MVGLESIELWQALLIGVGLGLAYVLRYMVLAVVLGVIVGVTLAVVIVFGTVMAGAIALWEKVTG